MNGVHDLRFGKILKPWLNVRSTDFWCVKNAIGRNAIWAGLYPGYGPGIVKHSGPGVGGGEPALLSCSKSRWSLISSTERPRHACFTVFIFFSCWWLRPTRTGVLAVIFF